MTQREKLDANINEIADRILEEICRSGSSIRATGLMAKYHAHYALRLHEAIERFNRQTAAHDKAMEKLTKDMLSLTKWIGRLTILIAVLTLIMAFEALDWF